MENETYDNDWVTFCFSMKGSNRAYYYLMIYLSCSPAVSLIKLESLFLLTMSHSHVLGPLP